MFFFFHLFTGLILGFLIGDILHDRRWVLPCAAGAILPDLIDKPLGHIVFADSIGYGRIYGHTLLFFFLVLFIGAVVWHYRKTPVIIALAIGILSHQVLDLMWDMPANWGYPFLGPFQGHLPADYMLTLIGEELNNPAEIAVAIALVAGILVFLKFRQGDGKHGKFRKVLSGILAITAFALLVLGGVILGRTLAGQAVPFPGWEKPAEYVLGGIIFVMAAYAAWQLHRELQDSS
jgi:membrane-bound metal-dependent hydrolase YbcI (DUF457 family)